MFRSRKAPGLHLNSIRLNSIGIELLSLEHRLLFIFLLCFHFFLSISHFNKFNSSYRKDVPIGILQDKYLGRLITQNSIKNQRGYNCCSGNTDFIASCKVHLHLLLFQYMTLNQSFSPLFKHPITF